MSCVEASVSDNRKYYENFRAKHQDKIHKRETCNVCFGSYTYYGKSKHMKSQKHLTAVSMRKSLSGESPAGGVQNEQGDNLSGIPAVP